VELQARVVAEEELMHFPELALGAGGLGGLGSELGIRVNLGERVVAKGISELIPELRLQPHNLEICGPASRTFIVAKFEKGQRSVGAPTNVVRQKNRQVVLGRGGIAMIVQLFPRFRSERYSPFDAS
jgi:hypothetical protein